MPYCSVQEAWGNSFHSENISEETQQNYERIVPDNSNKIHNELHETEYPTSDIKDKSGKSIYIPKKKKKQKRRKNFSRTMKRLPYKNGKEERYSKKNNSKRFKYRQSNISDTEDSDSEAPQKVFTDMDENPNYNEIPINNYDRHKGYRNDKKSRSITSFLNEKAYDSDTSNTSNNKYYTDAAIDSESDAESVISEEDTREYFQSKDKYIQHLEKQNVKLQRLLKEKLNSTHSFFKNKKTLLDLILYIISGIFIIYVLDTFVKLVRN